MNLKATFQQRFNHRAVRCLDRHRDRLGLGSGADNQPVAQLADPRTVVRDGAFLATLSLGIDQANLMALACPVDAYKPLDFISHVLTPSWSQPDHRDHRQSLYWRSKRNLPPDVRRGHPAGVQVLSRWSSHRVGSATPGRRPGPASLQADRFTTALKVQGWGEGRLGDRTAPPVGRKLAPAMKKKAKNPLDSMGGTIIASASCRFVVSGGVRRRAGSLTRKPR